MLFPLETTLLSLLQTALDALTGALHHGFGGEAQIHNLGLFFPALFFSPVPTNFKCDEETKHTGA